MYLIDTCIWIDFLRGVTSPKVTFLERLLEDGNAFLCPITYAEIMVGARDQRLLSKYQKHFSDFPMLQLREQWHIALSQMGFALRKSGKKPFIADLMIALTAIQNQVVLLTDDRDFLPYVKLFGLQVQ